MRTFLPSCCCLRVGSPVQQLARNATPSLPALDVQTPLEPLTRSLMQSAYRRLLAAPRLELAGRGKAIVGPLCRWPSLGLLHKKAFPGAIRRIEPAPARVKISPESLYLCIVVPLKQRILYSS